MSGTRSEPDERYVISDERLVEIKGLIDWKHAGWRTNPKPGVTVYDLAAAVDDLLIEREEAEMRPGLIEARDWQEYECAHEHCWWSAPPSKVCPVCGTTTFKPVSTLRDHVLGGIGPGTAASRMNAVWAWLHEEGAGRERVLEELCPGWSILSSRITSEQALMAAFDALVSERVPK